MSDDIGKALADGFDVNGTLIPAGSELLPASGFMTGFQQYTVSTTGLLSGLPTDKLFVVPFGNGDVVQITPTATSANDGTYVITNYDVNFFATAVQTPAPFNIVVDVYVASND